MLFSGRRSSEQVLKVGNDGMGLEDVRNAGKRRKAPLTRTAKWKCNPTETYENPVAATARVRTSPRGLGDGLKRVNGSVLPRGVRGETRRWVPPQGT